MRDVVPDAVSSRPSSAQDVNRVWWQSHPMTYDWQQTLAHAEGSPEWFAEIDRRFFESADFARGADGTPFGRFLDPSDVSDRAVLEIGCGMGTHAAMLARAGARLTAIDLTDRAVQMTRRRFHELGLTARIERADAEELPFPDGSFDMVWSWGVIHHSSSTERCLDEIARVLRPSGRVMIMVYYRPSLVYYLHTAFIRGVLMGGLLTQSLQELYTAASDGAYARVFTKRELAALAAPAFEDVRLSVVGIRAELCPMPRGVIKDILVSWTPPSLARAILARWGSMIVLEARRRQAR